MSEIEKIIFLPDLHVPFQINLDPIWEFIGDFKPTEVILGGDVHDWTAVSMWIADQSRHLDGGTIMENYRELGEKVLVPLQRAAKGVRSIYLTGNHEDWLRQAIELNPNGKGYWELEKNLPKGIKIVPINKVYQVGSNLAFAHGFYTGKYHARQTVEACHTTSVLYGHTHDIQTHVVTSLTSVKHFYKGQSCGCLCSLNPDYLKNKPNRWVNGFNYVYVEKKGGLFWDNQITIVDGKFWGNGRMYR